MDIGRTLKIAVATLGLALVSIATLASASGATVPGQNGKIAFVKIKKVSEEIGNISAVYTINPSGGAARRITFGSEGIAPTFSPDGKKVAYQGYNDQIFLTEASGKGPTRELTGGPSCEYASIGSPTFEPSGNSLLFGCYDIRARNADLYRLGASGDNKTPAGLVVGSMPSDNLSQAVSPNGKKLAYITGHYGGPGSIVTMNRNGSGAVPLDTGSLSANYPTYFPDGSKIAFAGGEYGNTQIYSINTDGSGLTQLTFGGSSKTSPVYSPDGKKIAYQGSQGALRTISTMDADGSHPKALISDPGIYIYGTVDWQRKSPMIVKTLGPRKRAISVKLFAPGKLVVKGHGIFKSKRVVSAGGRKKVRLRLRHSVRRHIQRRGKVKLKLRIAFHPRGALSSHVKATKLLRRR